MTKPSAVLQSLGEAAERREVPAYLLKAAFDEMMSGQASESQIAGLLVALRVKGETVSEIVATAQALRSAATMAGAADPRTGDTCGTGGTGRSTFSISTTSAFVVAGAGVPVAKHGNRAMSSRTGSFDTLEALGVNIELSIARCAEILAEIGIAPFYARTAHPAFRHVAPVRQALGIRTLLNCMGPLLNPVGAMNQIVGVYAKELVEPLAQALGQLGARRALVVHGEDGLDELTTTASSHVAFCRGDELEVFDLNPTDLGLSLSSAEDLTGGDAGENARICWSILEGEEGPRRDIVLLNAAGALWAADAVDGLQAGIQEAAHSIDSGAARERLDKLVRASNRPESIQEPTE
ncbi:MAG: anthranilate phosphoribosyltransferase [bacterium TMED88]|nr:anthranilate phosphoribosyltransferase [Deltaproteobacteria bacterium]OUV35964.1 MAG: anthranilate phosphoribosyltransferase [bacterium TMED88]